MTTDRIEGQRLTLIPLRAAYLRDYLNGFDAEAARYQFAETFPHIRDAAEYFHDCYLREQARMGFVRLIVSKDGSFMGSVEAHGLWGQTVDLGLWLTTSCRGQGYGREALLLLVEFLVQRGYHRFRYETDMRNAASVRLIEGLNAQKIAHEDVCPKHGKQLYLDLYELHR